MDSDVATTSINILANPVLDRSQRFYSVIVDQECQIKYYHELCFFIANEVEIVRVTK